MPWRTEPEISEEQQRYLAERRAIQPDIEKGIYPFKDIKLDRADVEWLLATHESDGMRGPVDWQDKKQRRREGLDLRGANLHSADLGHLPLACLRGSLTWEEQPEGSGDGVDAAAIQLQRARLQGAHLENAVLREGRLASADLRDAVMTGANLYGADLSDARLGHAVLLDTNLRRAIFSPTSNLYGVTLANAEGGAPRLRDVQWNGVDLTVVDWGHVQRLGDETTLKRPGRPMYSTDLPNATRAYRQVATVLRGQGLSEHADRFAYRAQLLQRRVFRRQRLFLKYGGSLLLGLISGYGYRPLRSFITYLVLVGTFAGIYALLAYFGLTAEHFNSWDSPLVLSVTSFHGRVFFAGGLPLDDWAARVGAIEAVFGLLIEITFIATFTQRFFAR
jgi:hypothetical protein